MGSCQLTRADAGERGWGRTTLEVILVDISEIDALDLGSDAVQWKGCGSVLAIVFPL